MNVTVRGLAGTGTCDFTSTIQLILQTTSANGYNFVFPNVGVGTYYLSIQAAADSGAVVSAGTGSAIGGAAYGLGSLTVESVRMVQNFSFQFSQSGLRIQWQVPHVWPILPDVGFHNSRADSGPRKPTITSCYAFH